MSPGAKSDFRPSEEGGGQIIGGGGRNCNQKPQKRPKAKSPLEICGNMVAISDYCFHAIPSLKEHAHINIFCKIGMFWVVSFLKKIYHFEMQHLTQSMRFPPLLSRRYATTSWTSPLWSKPIARNKCTAMPANSIDPGNYSIIAPFWVVSFLGGIFSSEKRSPKT